MHHTGVSNAFQKQNQTLIQRFNGSDESLNEKIHLEGVLRVLEVEDNNILKQLNEVDTKEVKQTITKLLLNTDLAVHFR